MWGKCGAGKRGRRGVAGGRARQEKKLEYSVCREFVKGLFRKTAARHPFLDRGSSIIAVLTPKLGPIRL